VLYKRQFVGVLHTVKESDEMDSAEMPVSVPRKRARSPASVTRRTKKRRAQQVKARDSPASPQLGMNTLIKGLYLYKMNNLT